MKGLRLLLLLGLAALGGWAATWRAGEGDAIAAPLGAAAGRVPTPAVVGQDGPTVDAATATTSADVRRIAEELQRRQRTLEAREAEVEARLVTLRALERSVGNAVARLDGSSLAAGRASGEPCRLRGGVTQIYENMRPDQAAPILDRLDDETLRVVFARMQTEKVAAIFAEMSRERAVAFTRTLALDDPVPGAAPDRMARR